MIGLLSIIVFSEIPESKGIISPSNSDGQLPNNLVTYLP